MGEPINVEWTSGALHDKVIQVPSNVEAILPSPATTIQSLLSFEGLPACPSLLANELPSPASCITDKEAQWTCDELLESPVLPRTWLGDLWLEQKLSKSRTISLQHPTNHTLYLPPWGITMWYSILHTVEQRGQWVDAIDWLSSQQSDSLDSTKVMALVGKVPWGMTIWAINESTSPIGILAELLSHKWLREWHLGTFASYLASRIKEHVGKWWIGGADFPTFISGLPETPRRTAGGSMGLEGFQDIFAAGGYEHLLFPANVNKNHWIVFCVDIKRREFCFGVYFHSTRCEYTCTYHLLIQSRELTSWCSEGQGPDKAMQRADKLASFGVQGQGQV